MSSSCAVKEDNPSHVPWNKQVLKICCSISGRIQLFSKSNAEWCVWEVTIDIESFSIFVKNINHTQINHVLITWLLNKQVCIHINLFVTRIIQQMIVYSFHNGFKLIMENIGDVGKLPNSLKLCWSSPVLQFLKTWTF